MVLQMELQDITVYQQTENFSEIHPGKTRINGKYYGFDAQGRMYENTTFEVKDFYGNLITYHASKGGALLTSQKYESGNDIYYFDVCGRGYEGRHYVDGRSCYFEKGKIVG